MPRQNKCKEMKRTEQNRVNFVTPNSNGNVNVKSDPQGWTPVVDGYGQALVNDTAALLSSLTPVVDTSMTIDDATRYAEIGCLSTGAGSPTGMRLRFDGTDPTTSVGELLAVGDTKVVSVASLKKLKVVRDGSTNVNITVHQYS